MKKRVASGGLDPQWKAIASAQEQAMQAFEKMVHRAMVPVLGPAGVKKIQREAAIITTMRRCVAVYAPLRERGKLTPERIRREKPKVAVLATMVPLLDPVTLQTVSPGVYAVGLRWVGGKDIAFDLYGEKGRPTISTLAQTKDAGADDGSILGFDIDITLPDIDSIFPPPNGRFCISFLHWKKCWNWDWPEWPW